MKTCLGLVVLCTVLVSGCASVPRTQSNARGLLQTEPQGSAKVAVSVSDEARAQLPISIAPVALLHSDSGFVWPVKQGRVSSFFGSRTRDYHEGIDIRTERGSPIYAAMDGEVIYSSRKIHGYGNMVVIRHNGGFSTVYAHCRKNLVKVGQHVTQGQLVAYVGATGKATGPHLHFEIRRGELPEDPLLYLPQTRTPAMATSK